MFFTACRNSSNMAVPRRARRDHDRSASSPGGAVEQTYAHGILQICDRSGNGRLPCVQERGRLVHAAGLTTVISTCRSCSFNRRPIRSLSCIGLPYHEIDISISFNSIIRDNGSHYFSWALAIELDANLFATQVIESTPWPFRIDDVSVCQRCLRSMGWPLCSLPFSANARMPRRHEASSSSFRTRLVLPPTSWRAC